jgi:hypothetical protein
MEEIIAEWQLKYYSATDYLYGEFTTYYPRFDNYNRFEKFIILNLVVIAIYIVFTFLSSFSIKRIYKKVVKFVFSFGPIRREVAKNLDKARTEILAEYPPELLPKLDKIPYKAPDITFDDAS